MNFEKELVRKEKELKIVNNIVTETLILSQQKYMDYIEEQTRLKEEIKQLKKNIEEHNNIKTWINNEEGWRIRVYKNE